MFNSTLKRVVACIVLLLLAAVPSVAGASNKKQKDEVEAVLNMQADAWNRGDLDAFMTGYLKSPDTSYTSGGTEVWGYEALQKRYADKYGTKRDTMGKLRFSDLKVFELGKDNALCIGHWHLERTSMPLAEGIFSLVLVNTTSGWKVLHDHTTSTTP